MSKAKRVDLDLDVGGPQVVTIQKSQSRRMPREKSQRSQLLLSDASSQSATLQRQRSRIIKREGRGVIETDVHPGDALGDSEFAPGEVDQAPAQIVRKSRCPKRLCTYNALQQQKVDDCCCGVVTGNVLMLYSCACAVLCAIVALAVGIDTSSVREQGERFDNKAGCEITATTSTFPQTCSFNITLDVDLEAPVYFYYSYKGFHQNHRRYVRSMSMDQLLDIDATDVGNCEPDDLQTYNGKTIYPCGLLADTFPPDRFTIAVNGQDLCPACTSSVADDRNNQWEEANSWSKADIAHKVAVDAKFIEETSTDDLSTTNARWTAYGRNLPLVNDKDFMNWMRPAPLTSFKKLYRVITDRDLKKGDRVEVTVYAYFYSGEWETEKWIVLANTGAFGGDNTLLMITSVFSGTICLCFTLYVICIDTFERGAYKLESDVLQR